MEDGFGRVEEEVVEVGFSDVGWDEEVVLFKGADGSGAGEERGRRRRSQALLERRDEEATKDATEEKVEVRKIYSLHENLVHEDFILSSSRLFLLQRSNRVRLGCSEEACLSIHRHPREEVS